MEFEDKYPEHIKMEKIPQQNRDLLGDFLSYLQERGIELAVWRPNGFGDASLHPVFKRTEEWMAEFFKIDLKKIDEEKSRMLEEIRNGSL